MSSFLLIITYYHSLVIVLSVTEAPLEWARLTTRQLLLRAFLTSSCVSFLPQQYLRSPVPTCCDIVSHCNIVMHQLRDISSCQPKITDFKVAVLIHENVLGFLSLLQVTKSRWRIPAEWIYFKPLKIWYMKNLACWSDSYWGDLIIEAKSLSMSS